MNQLNTVVYPYYSSNSFTSLTLFLLVMMSLVPTAVLYSLFKTIDRNGSFNTNINMLLIPNLGIVIPYIFIIEAGSMFVASVI